MSARRVDPHALAPDTALARRLGRAAPLRTTVTLEYDNRTVRAPEGEPLAIALLAAGEHTLARSVKFHRPRGPNCLRGACDGCLTRVDGVPNVMACRVPAREGARVQSQNAFPTASVDLLRVTDWFFPKRFDHHELMVRYGTTINQTMQVFARRMAGLGTLPDRDGETPLPESLECDAVVVGAGPAGLAAATEIARSGARVVLLEEEGATGGTLRDEMALLETAKGAKVTGVELADALLAAARAAGVIVRTGASATATFDNATLAITAERAVLVRARARVFANGCHESVGTFENNDMPGVYTARAAARALGHGVMVGERVVIVGSAWPAAGLAEALRAAGASVEWVPDGVLDGADGGGSVSYARMTKAGAALRSKCDALVVADEPTPAYELLGQAGVAVLADATRVCFAPRVESDGRTERGDVFATGSVRGAASALGTVDLARPLACGGPVADGVRVAASVREGLRASDGRSS